MGEAGVPPRVLISYSHDSQDHEARVLALSNRLRAGGIDCTVDLYDKHPPEGWPRWMDRQLRESHFVLVVCTETYLRRAEGKEAPGIGLGVRWESAIMYDQIYSMEMSNKKFIPCIFSAADKAFILAPLSGHTHYLVSDETGYESLYRRLTNQPDIAKPDVRPFVTVLPPKPTPALDQVAKPEVDAAALSTEELLRIVHHPGVFQEVPVGLARELSDAIPSAKDAIAIVFEAKRLLHELHPKDPSLPPGDVPDESASAAWTKIVNRAPGYGARALAAILLCAREGRAEGLLPTVDETLRRLVRTRHR
jgi:hypothetical protein